jgi:hypothetical protein
MTPNQPNEENSVHLDELNEELSESLERCHTILDDYRSMLGAEIPKTSNSAPPSPSGTSASA